jgi:hypothetical protein
MPPIGNARSQNVLERLIGYIIPTTFFNVWMKSGPYRSGGHTIIIISSVAHSALIKINQDQFLPQLQHCNIYRVENMPGMNVTLICLPILEPFKYRCVLPYMEISFGSLYGLGCINSPFHQPLNCIHEIITFPPIFANISSERGEITPVRVSEGNPLAYGLETLHRASSYVVLPCGNFHSSDSSMTLVDTHTRTDRFQAVISQLTEAGYY